VNREPIADCSALPRLAPGQTLIDSHCHLEMDVFDADRDAVFARAAAAGIETMITIGASGPLASNHAAVALAERHPQVFATVGIHPHDASTADEATLAVIAELAGRPKVVAIGETGLDYYYDNSPRQQQQEALRRFVAMARACRLPLVVHLRAADDDALRILHDEHAADVGGVIHCFSGDAHSARRFLDLGFALSFSGIVTFKTADAVREAAAITPADRLLVGERSKLQLYRALEIFKPRWLRRRIMKQEYGRVGVRIGQKLEPLALTFSEYTLRHSFQRGRDLAPDSVAAGSLCLRHPLVRLIPARAGVREMQKVWRQRKVDILGEPLDHAEHLRQRGATLEHQAAGKL